MNAPPSNKSFWSVGQLAADVGRTVADVENAARALGISRPDLSLNGVAYFSAHSAARLREAMDAGAEWDRRPEVRNGFATRDRFMAIRVRHRWA